jgi:hypothetical protein
MGKTEISKGKKFTHLRPLEKKPISGSTILSEREIQSQLPGLTRPGERLFLERYSKVQIFEMLEQHNVIDRLHKLGFHDILIDISCDDVRIHYLKVYDKEIDPRNLLIDLRLREYKFIPQTQFLHSFKFRRPLNMISIEWLSMQNPRLSFGPDRPRLPDQIHPGLGFLKNFITLLGKISTDFYRDGFLDIPEHFHGAVMYSKGFNFYNPEQEGIFAALMRDLGNLSLCHASYAILWSCVRVANSGGIFEWHPEEQIYPVSRLLVKYFSSKEYIKIFEKSLRENSFVVDEAKFKKMLEDAKLPFVI